MKMRFDFPEQTEPRRPSRGAATVGLLQELPPVELAAIVHLRAWCAGAADRQMISRDFQLVLDKDAAEAAVKDFDDLVALLLKHARRPLIRHSLSCDCFGCDESAFAHLIAAVCGQDREEAFLFASLLITGHASWTAVLLAERLGQVFLRLARFKPEPWAPTHRSGQGQFKH